MSYPRAKINELDEQIKLLTRAYNDYPDNMDLVKTAESIKVMQAERKQWEGLAKASYQLRIKENVKLN